MPEPFPTFFDGSPKRESWKDKARRGMAGDQAAIKELVGLLGMGHTRSGASGFLYRQKNGRGVRSFNKAMRSWAEG